MIAVVVTAHVILVAVLKVTHPMTCLQRTRGVAEVQIQLIRNPALGAGWSPPIPGCLYPRKHPVPTVQEAEWASEPVGRTRKILTPKGIQSADRPTCRPPLLLILIIQQIPSIRTLSGGS